jgi:hypothetical protein
VGGQFSFFCSSNLFAAFLAEAKKPKLSAPQQNPAGSQIIILHNALVSGLGKILGVSLQHERNHEEENLLYSDFIFQGLVSVTHFCINQSEKKTQKEDIVMYRNSNHATTVRGGGPLYACVLL